MYFSSIFETIRHRKEGPYPSSAPPYRHPLQVRPLPIATYPDSRSSSGNKLGSSSSIESDSGRQWLPSFSRASSKRRRPDGADGGDNKLGSSSSSSVESDSGRQWLPSSSRASAKRRRADGADGGNDKLGSSSSSSSSSDDSRDSGGNGGGGGSISTTPRQSPVRKKWNPWSIKGGSWSHCHFKPYLTPPEEEKEKEGRKYAAKIDDDDDDDDDYDDYDDL